MPRRRGAIGGLRPPRALPNDRTGRLSVIATDVVEQLVGGRGCLADQPRRAATSLPLDIAAAAGEFSAADEARCDRIAERPAAERTAILDVRRLHLVAEERYVGGRELLRPAKWRGSSRAGPVTQAPQRALRIAIAGVVLARSARLH